MKSLVLSNRFNAGTLTTFVAVLALCSGNSHCGSDDPPEAAAGSSGSGGVSGSTGTSGTGGAAGASGTIGASGTGTGATAGTTGVDSASDSSETGGTAGNPDAGDAAEDVFVDPTVRGTLKTIGGRPFAGAIVLVGDRTVVSNAQGEFTVENVPASYDLIVLARSSNGQTQVYIYIGLASRQPIVSIQANDPFLRTTVQGSLSPGYPQQESQRTGIGFKSANQDASGTLTLEGVQGPTYGPLDVAWTTGTTVAGQLFALQWRVGTTSFPTGYQGWVIQPLSVTSATPATANLVLATLSQREVTGTVRFPPEARSVSARLYVENLRVFDNAVQFSPGGTSVSYAYPIPIGIGNVARNLSFHATLDANSVASTDLTTKLNDTSATVDFELPSPPNVALPIDRATGVNSNTEFEWTAVPNAVYRLGIINASTNTGYIIHTSSTKTKVPDLSSKGIPWASGNHLWNVQALGPAVSVDTCVTGTSVLEAEGREFVANAAYRLFTAATQ